MKFNNNIIFLLISIFWILLQISFGYYRPVLSDDIGHYYSLIMLQSGKLSDIDVLKEFFNDPNRHSRPMSALLMSLMMIFSLKSAIVYFLWGFLTLLNIYLLKKILDRYFSDNGNFILLSLFISLTFGLSSSNIFSIVMQHIQYIIFVFLYTIFICDSEKNSGYLLAGLLLLTSLLLYEQNLFLIPIVIILIFHHFKFTKTAFIKIFLSCILPIILLAIYRMWLVKLIYPSYYDYGASKFEFGISRSIVLIGSLIKLFLLDYCYILYKSIVDVVHYQWYDYVLLVIGLVVCFVAIKSFNKNEYKIGKNKIMLLILFFLLTLVVFFISNYPPIAFGFTNRMLVWVRYSSSILLSAFLYNTLIWSQKTKFFNLIKLLIFLLLMCNVIMVISEKNSYIRASEYNKYIVAKIVDNFPNSMENTRILVFYDKEKGKRFVTDESIIDADYEINSALSLYQPQSNLKGENIIFFNPTTYALYEIFGKPFNKRPKSEYELNSKFIRIGKRTLSFPFYIYDLNTNNTILINDKEDFKLP